MEVKDFINGKVTYDKYDGQCFCINDANGGVQMLAELRGWVAIQNLFMADGKNSGKYIDLEAAGDFQDKVGEFIAEAINEKIERAAMTISPTITEASAVAIEIANSPSTEKRLTAISKEMIQAEGWYSFEKGAEFKVITQMKKLTLIEDGLGSRYWIKNDLLEIVSK